MQEKTTPHLAALQSIMPSIHARLARIGADPRFQYALLLLELLGLAALTFTGAYALRFDFQLDGNNRGLIVHTLPVLLCLRAVTFVVFGLHRRWFRYISFADVFAITAAVIFSSLTFGLFVLWQRDALYFPRSVVFLDCILLQFAIASYYSSLRIWQAVRHRTKWGSRRVLLVGDTAAMPRVLRELHASARWRPIGVVNGNTAVVGRKLLGVPVKGTFDQLLEVVAVTRAETVVFLTHGMDRTLLLRLLTQCRSQSIEFVCFDGAALLNASTPSENDQRDIELILQRREIPIDVAAVQQLIHGRRVLVTGAGGSIGAELCRQIAAYEPGEIFLLDRSENNLFFVHRELTRRWPQLRVHPILADITDEPDLQRVFLAAQPHAVFHAAAHKHVGMMERQPHLAIKNNVIGTTNAARAAIAAGAELFVNISTDKAVKPTSYMGLSKRLAELCIQEISEGASTRFVIVRFGNVAGSTGSVVQLFRQQIARGEALTVTDRNATRFFMSISEAVSLVLQAAVLGESGRIFVLDTGESVNIYELAKTMICLAGYVPDVDIPIRFTGLTGGEKLNEELWDPSEEVEKRLAQDRLIMIRVEERRVSVLERVGYWRQLVDADRLPDLIAELRRVWPSFRYQEREAAMESAPWRGHAGLRMGLATGAGFALRNAHRLPREER